MSSAYTRAVEALADDEDRQLAAQDAPRRRASDHDTVDLERDARLLAELVNDIDTAVSAGDVGPDLERAVAAWDVIEDANRQLAIARANLANLLGGEFPEKRLTVMGSGVYERHAKREGSTKCSDPEGLWRLVLDTRIVEEETGEVLPTHEIIRRVYGSKSKETGLVRLTGASPTKVEAIGIAPDEFFEKAPMVGWTIQKVG
jgi:hypothetical protein